MGIYRLDDGDDFDDVRIGRVPWEDTMAAIDRAMLNVQNARQQAGKYYRGQIVTRDWPILYREINRAFIKLTGKRLEESIVKHTDFELQERYEGLAKGWYKARARRKAVVSERPLFQETEGDCLIYAHTGLVAKYPGVRLIKIGYTRQPLRDYLAGKRIQHDPKLLAWVSGDEVDEANYKRKWKQAGMVADGNEWLWPERQVIDWIMDTYDSLEPEFPHLIREAEQMLSVYRRASLR